MKKEWIILSIASLIVGAALLILLPQFFYGQHIQEYRKNGRPSHIAQLLATPPLSSSLKTGKDIHVFNNRVRFQLPSAWAPGKVYTEKNGLGDLSSDMIWFNIGSPDYHQPVYPSRNFLFVQKMGTGEVLKDLIAQQLTDAYPPSNPRFIYFDSSYKGGRIMRWERRDHLDTYLAIEWFGINEDLGIHFCIEFPVNQHKWLFPQAHPTADWILQTMESFDQSLNSVNVM